MAATLASDAAAALSDPRLHGLQFRRYESEAQLPAIAALIARDLSEPYSVYTYRYFLNEWPQLCWTVRVGALRRPRAGTASS